MYLDPFCGHARVMLTEVSCIPTKLGPDVRRSSWHWSAMHLGMAFGGGLVGGVSNKNLGINLIKL